MGRLFDAESYPSNCRSQKKGKSQVGHWGCTTPIYPSYQFQGRVARGHLWQERFSSFVMDEHYLLSCARYIENNPVRAKLATSPDKWAWSSALAHMAEKNDKLVNVEPVLSIISGDWRQFLSGAFSNEDLEEIRKHSRTGRPPGSSAFVAGLEHKLCRKLEP